MEKAKIIHRAFGTRRNRAEFIAEHFGPWLSGSLLDVGCDQADLKDLVPGCNYMGVDVAGAPDITIDLEHSSGLPFSDHEFDVVVCADVLEHLDNLHTVFGELVRVTRRHLIVSLPNNWGNARRPIGRGKGEVNKYGLPSEQPGDRHKWFFNTTEAMDFLRAQAERFPISVRELVVMEKPRPLLVRAFRRLRYPKPTHYLNRYAHTVWVIYDKDPTGERGHT